MNLDDTHVCIDKMAYYFMEQSISICGVDCKNDNYEISKRENMIAGCLFLKKHPHNIKFTFMIYTRVY